MGQQSGPQYVIREATALGENQDQDARVDQANHIIWLRAGLNERDKRRALKDAAEVVGRESPSVVNDRGATVPRVGDVS
jgi:hypothetical protein